MTTVEEDKLHVVLQKDRYRVVLGVPGDIPFTAASIQAMLSVLQPYSYGPPEYTWSRMFGLRFILSLDDREPPEFDFEALANLDLPLRVEQPAQSEPLRALFIDTINPSNDSVAVLRPEQVLTSYRLNDLVDSWISEDNLLNEPWFMRSENNCLVLGMRDAPRVVFARVISPVYGATVEPIAIVRCDDSGRTGQASITLRYRSTQRNFEANLEPAKELPGFSDLSERRRIIRATYIGPEAHQVDPELLVSDLRQQTLKLMRALGVHQSLHGKFTVVIDKSGCTAKTSSDNLELIKHFPIDPE